MITNFLHPTPTRSQRFTFTISVVVLSLWTMLSNNAEATDSKLATLSDELSEPSAQLDKHVDKAINVLEGGHSDVMGAILADTMMSGRFKKVFPLVNDAMDYIHQVEDSHPGLFEFHPLEVYALVSDDDGRPTSTSWDTEGFHLARWLTLASAVDRALTSLDGSLSNDRIFLAGLELFKGKERIKHQALELAPHQGLNLNGPNLDAYPLQTYQRYQIHRLTRADQRARQAMHQIWFGNK